MRKISNWRPRRQNYVNLYPAVVHKLNSYVYMQERLLFEKLSVLEFEFSLLCSVQECLIDLTSKTDFLLKK